MVAPRGQVAGARDDRMGDELEIGYGSDEDEFGVVRDLESWMARVANKGSVRRVQSSCRFLGRFQWVGGTEPWRRESFMVGGMESQRGRLSWKVTLCRAFE